MQLYLHSITVDYIGELLVFVAGRLATEIEYTNRL